MTLLDLERVTRLDVVASGADRSSYRLDPDPAVAGFPGLAFGGYLTAMALRAAAEHATITVPVSLSMANLGFARLDRPVEIDVVTLRRSSRSETVEIHCHQGTPVFRAIVWTATDGDQPARSSTPAPSAPPPGEVETDVARLRRRGRTDMPTTYAIAEWRSVGEREMPMTRWLRITPEDPSSTVAEAMAAARALVAVDANPYAALKTAAGSPWAGTDEFTWGAPTIDVYAHFHHTAGLSEWLLTETTAEIDRGRLSSTTRVWTEDGRPVCTGMSQGLIREL